MLDLIAKSKIRQNILRFLFARPRAEFYLSEIAKNIKASVGTCRRELNQMVKSGILKIKKRGNLVIYSVNQQSPIYAELAEIINKTIGPESELKKLIKSFSKIKFAFIFGSYASKNFSADSDLDLFLIGSLDENKFIKALRRREKTLNREINYHLYGEKEFKEKIKKNSFLQNISKHYLLLTDNKDEFKKLLK